jgi:hypothetical protein
MSTRQEQDRNGGAPAASTKLVGQEETRSITELGVDDHRVRCPRRQALARPRQLGLRPQLVGGIPQDLGDVSLKVAVAFHDQDVRDHVGLL